MSRPVLQDDEGIRAALDHADLGHVRGATVARVVHPQHAVQRFEAGSWPQGIVHRFAGQVLVPHRVDGQR